MVLDCCAIGPSEYHKSMASGSTWPSILAVTRGRAAVQPAAAGSRWPSTRILAKCKLIAEAWDAGGLYQVRLFPGLRTLGRVERKYRDGVRRFLR